MEEAFSFWGTPEGDRIHPADCMQELLEKVRRHKVNIDGNVCTVMVTTLVLEVNSLSCFLGNLKQPKTWQIFCEAMMILASQLSQAVQTDSLS